uniref:Macaca fascicularis brain cDNA clone: QflA-17153, similar to human adaptor-related protein complex 2, beta 1 subunit(AP2B1), mRNA, RefSeq: NM_001282.1 n=1 Tax=Macaca fascicularis TaxID=9541 RepID=I7G5B8_MACFA|nr:unnamed protein product [Macaca fascicularis]
MWIFSLLFFFFFFPSRLLFLGQAFMFPPFHIIISFDCSAIGNGDLLE